MERVQVTEKQVEGVRAFQARYPKYTNDDIIEIAAAPKYIPAMYEKFEALEAVTLNELAMILNGHYEVIDQVQQAIVTNPVLSKVQMLIEGAKTGTDDAKLLAQNVLYGQTEKGITKYGSEVDFNSLMAEEWAQHALEEMADGMVYLQALLLKLQLMKDGAMHE